MRPRTTKGFHRAEGQFDVLRQLDNPVSFDEQTLTSHFNNERGERVSLVSSRVSDPLYSFVVNTGHPHGYEIHTITERAEIVIQNKMTMKVVTVLFARPPQINRYWRNLGKKTPNDETFSLVSRYAQNNLDRNLNNI